jgi:hypothetical protein
MNHKCFQCLQVGHTFRNCSDIHCACACVSQLASFPKNNEVDSVSVLGPHFLQIRDDEVAKLPYPYKQISRFMKVREHEWLPTEVDKRRKARSY